MAKVLLVEDDNNLREIYEARLQAEGYEIVTASDGEEALVVAKREKPELIISDVMMPKISGFEMLDILRNTEELKNVKVIMLTALGQAEDKSRADQLGANKYLVKSQVTLEDIVKTAHQLLDEPAVATDTTTAAATDPVSSPPVDVSSSAPVVAQPIAASGPEPVTADPAPVAVAPEPTATPAPASTSIPVMSVNEPPADPVQVTAVVDPPATSDPVAPLVTDVPVVASAPVPEPTPATAPVEAITSPAGDAVVPGSLADEVAGMEAQIESFVEAPASVPAQVEPAPADPAAPAPEITTPETTEPPATTPVAIVPTAEVTENQVVTDAVESMIADTENQGKPSDVTAVEVAPPPTTVPVAVSNPMPAPATESETTDDSTQIDVPTVIAGKKIIQPLSDETPKLDINTLLAQEEAKEAADTPITPPAANTIVAPPPEDAEPTPPTAAPQPPANGTDPDSIAL